MQSKIYEKKIPIEIDWLDYKKTLKLSSLFRIFQDVSLNHLELLSLGDEATRKQNIHWVVSRYHVEINRLPKYGETITVSTHPAPNIAFFFPRHYEILSESGEVLIKAGSLWALVDEKERKMVRPDEYRIPNLGILIGNELQYPLPYRTNEGKNHCGMKAAYSDCDINGHLNNCSYFDIVEDLIPISYLSSHSAKAIDVHYKKEILIGENIEVSFEETNDLYTFHSDNFSLGIQFEESNN